MIKKAYCVILLFALLISLGACFKIQPKILNGFPSELGQFPFYAFLRTKERHHPKDRYICGGSLLNNEFILTAAHCLYNVTKVEIHLGSLRKGEHEEGRQVFFARTKHLYPHPDYNDEYLLNDIGLIKLPRPAIFSDRIQPVQFPMIHDVFEGMDLVAIGNGHRAKRKSATILQFALLTTITRSECKNMYPYIDENKTFCAKGSFNESVCLGDSGGPVVVNGLEDTLYGITSFLNSTDCDGAAQGFTSVFPYIPWILQVTGIDLQILIQKVSNYSE